MWRYSRSCYLKGTLDACTAGTSWLPENLVDFGTPPPKGRVAAVRKDAVRLIAYSADV